MRHLVNNTTNVLNSIAAMGKDAHQRFRHCGVTINHNRYYHSPYPQVRSQSAGNETGQEAATRDLGRQLDFKCYNCGKDHSLVDCPLSPTEVAFLKLTDAMSNATVASGLIKNDMEHAVRADEAREKVMAAATVLAALIHGQTGNIELINAMDWMTSGMVDVIDKMKKGSDVWGEEKLAAYRKARAEGKK
ncbi:hypothetical protein K461DRAFT_319108 [Myriangium duriaei CBS 260.36]|uniref:Uncharacterized protein n=1 Tax=Myriangium duriaei CBS 260.36 TaxID=1168546 RepID=A0A9P4J5N3_9PEZI|nr:hypothetical protein K461DRAFT_319108 [Myriangium duriaei CBS 260.36]